VSTNSGPSIFQKANTILLSSVITQSAPDEVDAHTTMFYTSSYSYYNLGLRASALIVSCLENEQRYGDQVHTQSDGDKEHGQSSEDAYGIKEEQQD
jgi:hypothetical protein